MVRNIYGFTDSGKKVKVGEYDDGLNPVGGRIFYIDPNSDETVEFYDANGNEISNVVVGDTPAYYKVTSAGVSGKEKYYVYQEVYESDKSWTYNDGSSWVYENTGFTSQDIGAGKSNTAGIMALHNGAYALDSKTIWYVIKQYRTTNLGGCSDWYIGTKGELIELKSFINENKSKLGLEDLFNTRVWSSSEKDTATAYNWTTSSWSYNVKDYKYPRAIPIRSF